MITVIAVILGTVQGVVTGIRGLCQGLGPAVFGFIFYLFNVDLNNQDDSIRVPFRRHTKSPISSQYFGPVLLPSSLSKGVVPTPSVINNPEGVIKNLTAAAATIAQSEQISYINQVKIIQYALLYIIFCKDYCSVSNMCLYLL